MSSTTTDPTTTTSSNTNNARKRVRISENHTVDAVDSRTEEEREGSWWTASEFAASKDSVKRQCRSHRLERRYSDCLTDAYESACVLANPEDDYDVDGGGGSSSDPGKTNVTKPAFCEATQEPNKVRRLLRAFYMAGIQCLFYET